MIRNPASSWADRQRALSAAIAADASDDMVLFPVAYSYWTVDEIPGTIGLVIQAARRTHVGKFTRVERLDTAGDEVEFPVADDAFRSRREGKGQGFAVGEIVANGAIALLTADNELVVPIYNPCPARPPRQR